MESNEIQRRMDVLYDQKKSRKGPDGRIVSRVFYTKKAFEYSKVAGIEGRRSDDWCHYCMCRDIVCRNHQVELTQLEFKEWIKCVLQHKTHPLIW